MDTTYWRSGPEDEAMQDEHGFIWQAMLETIDVDLAGKRVLDAGCNRGGFLRLLADRCGIAEGAGYDPAAGAIEDARKLVGQRPLRFEAADTVPAGWGGFDVAFALVIESAERVAHQMFVDIRIHSRSFLRILEKQRSDL